MYVHGGVFNREGGADGWYARFDFESAVWNPLHAEVQDDRKRAQVVYLVCVRARGYWNQDAKKLSRHCKLMFATNFKKRM